MDSRNGEKDGGVDVKEGGFRSKLKGFGSFWSKDMFVRADKIDLKSLDIQLETKMNKVWSKDNRGSTQRPKEEWEIDVAKLDVRYVLVCGTYGTVYRGSYDGQEVAGLKLWMKYLQILKFTTSMCFIGLFLNLVYWDLSWVTQWKILIHCFPSQFYIKALLVRLMCLP